MTACHGHMPRQRHDAQQYERQPAHAMATAKYRWPPGAICRQCISEQATSIVVKFIILIGIWPPRPTPAFREIIYSHRQSIYEAAESRSPRFRRQHDARERSVSNFLSKLATFGRSSRRRYRSIDIRLIRHFARRLLWLMTYIEAGTAYDEGRRL